MLQLIPGCKPSVTGRPLVEEVNADPEVVFTKFKADMVERMFVKCMRGHMARDSCEISYLCTMEPGGLLRRSWTTTISFATGW